MYIYIFSTYTIQTEGSSGLGAAGRGSAPPTAHAQGHAHNRGRLPGRRCPGARAAPWKSQAATDPEAPDAPPLPPAATRRRRVRGLGAVAAGAMVFLTVPLWLRSRLTDRYWRVQEVLRHARHFRGRKNRCYRLAVRAVTRAFVKCTRARRLKRRSMRTVSGPGDERKTGVRWGTRGAGGRRAGTRRAPQPLPLAPVLSAPRAARRHAEDGPAPDRLVAPACPRAVPGPAGGRSPRPAPPGGRAPEQPPPSSAAPRPSCLRGQAGLPEPCGRQGRRPGRVSRSAPRSREGRGRAACRGGWRERRFRAPHLRSGNPASWQSSSAEEARP